MELSTDPGNGGSHAGSRFAESFAQQALSVAGFAPLDGKNSLIGAAEGVP
jgi:hypothetical protein